jgi:hypothetical protein
MIKRLLVAWVAAGLLAVASKAENVVLTSDPTGATIYLRGHVEVAGPRYRCTYRLGCRWRLRLGGVH